MLTNGELNEAKLSFASKIGCVKSDIFLESIKRIVEWASSISQIDTSNASITINHSDMFANIVNNTHVVENVCIDQKILLSCSKNQKNGFFFVPKVIG